MLNRVLRFGVAATLSALALAFVVAVSPAAAESAASSAAPAASLATTALAAQLTPEEAAGLAYMREEEKLARDVYQYLYQQWKLPIFSNIAASEQTHMDALKTLLDRYQIADPAAGNAAGTFTNAHLQELYDQLIAQGRQSAAAALKVGVAIEKLDISDLQEQLDLTTKLDIKTVYQNLLKGSENHLRAFTSNQGRQGR
jgi:hypothetical protein